MRHSPRGMPTCIAHVVDLIQVLALKCILYDFLSQKIPWHELCIVFVVSDLWHHERTAALDSHSSSNNPVLNTEYVPFQTPLLSKVIHQGREKRRLVFVIEDGCSVAPFPA